MTRDGMRPKWTGQHVTGNRRSTSNKMEVLRIFLGRFWFYDYSIWRCSESLGWSDNLWTNSSDKWKGTGNVKSFGRGQLARGIRSGRSREDLLLVEIYMGISNCRWRRWVSPLRLRGNLLRLCIISLSFLPFHAEGKGSRKGAKGVSGIAKKTWARALRG